MTRIGNKQELPDLSLAVGTLLERQHVAWNAYSGTREVLQLRIRLGTSRTQPIKLGPVNYLNVLTAVGVWETAIAQAGAGTEKQNVKRTPHSRGFFACARDGSRRP